MLRCDAEANPPAKVTWKRLEDSNIYSFEPELSFKPLTRENTGSYICEAQNSIGTAMGKSIYLDVKCKNLVLIFWSLPVYVV